LVFPGASKTTFLFGYKSTRYVFLGRYRDNRGLLSDCTGTLLASRVQLRKPSKNMAAFRQQISFTPVNDISLTFQRCLCWANQRAIFQAQNKPSPRLKIISIESALKSSTRLNLCPGNWPQRVIGHCWLRCYLGSTEEGHTLGA
jgi:hypothetical protein